MAAHPYTSHCFPCSSSTIHLTLSLLATASLARSLSLSLAFFIYPLYCLLVGFAVALPKREATFLPVQRIYWIGFTTFIIFPFAEFCFTTRYQIGCRSHPLAVTLKASKEKKGYNCDDNDSTALDKVVKMMAALQIANTSSSSSSSSILSSVFIYLFLFFVFCFCVERRCFWAQLNYQTAKLFLADGDI